MGREPPSDGRDAARRIDVRDVVKRYGGATVLRGVTFALAPGAMATVGGRSGSGKSTLFRLLAGLDRPTSGEVLVGGVSLADLDDRAISEMRLRRIGLVFQSFNLLPDLTIAENVRLPLDIAGTPRAEARARVRELLELLGIWAHAEKTPNLLSGGEMQRAAIARALANRPGILLADEPTANLDEENGRNVMRAFHDVNRQLGTTLLIFTHDPLAFEMGGPRMTIRDGALTAPAELGAHSPAPPG